MIPQQEIYSLHRCIGWCLWSSVNTRTWWYRISNCLLISHFLETQRKWSTTKQEAYGVNYAVTKVNRWGLELATYNISFEWILGAKNKAADCLSCLVQLPQTISTPINMLSVCNTDEPTFNTRNQTQQCLASNTTTAQLNITPEVSPASKPTPKSLTADRLEALLQMQDTDPFCNWMSKCLSNWKVPHHETDLFTHVIGLLYKHITDSGQTFLALVMPETWKYTVLVDAHDNLRHQGNTCTYFLIKQQYYWKGMNKNIRKYIANCTLCCQGSKVSTSDDGDSQQAIQ